MTERWHSLGNRYRAVKFEAVAGNMLRGGIPADSDPQLIGQMASTGIIEFVDFGSLPVAAGTEVQTDLYGTGSESTYHTILTGREMKSAGLETDNFGNIATKFQLTEQGTQILADYTTAHTGEYLGIVWDGVVISAPRVAAAITDGVGIISGFGFRGAGARVRGSGALGGAAGAADGWRGENLTCQRPALRSDQRSRSMEFSGKLKGKVAVVAGATRGAGRGIACMLGEAGATVYCTGRSVRGSPATKDRPETIEETAEMVTAHGGMGIWRAGRPHAAGAGQGAVRPREAGAGRAPGHPGERPDRRRQHGG